MSRKASAESRMTDSAGHYSTRFRCANGAYPDGPNGMLMPRTMSVLTEC
jgi:hypothetical protein